METYPITVGGVTRHVPSLRPLPGRRIPLVEFLGDPEFTRAAAEALRPLVPKEAEILFTTETSPIPLTHVLAEALGLPYVVARRRRRPYMEDPIIQEVQTLTLGVGRCFGWTGASRKSSSTRGWSWFPTWWRAGRP